MCQADIQGIRQSHIVLEPDNPDISVSQNFSFFPSRSTVEKFRNLFGDGTIAHNNQLAWAQFLFPRRAGNCAEEELRLIPCIDREQNRKV